MNKKGFTLIELLAVIVILAIIALIATPVVLNIINDTNEQADLRSADFYLDAVELSIAQAVLDGENLADDTYTIKDGNICRNTDCKEQLMVEVKGDVPEAGTIYIKNGQIDDVSLNINDKIIGKNNEGKIAYINKLTDICTIASDSAATGYNAGAKYECRVKAGTKYTFYVLTTPTTTDTTINLIMDQNINSDGTLAGIIGVTQSTNPTQYNLVAWNTLSNTPNNISGPVDSMQFLNNATNLWSNISNLNTTYDDGSYFTEFKLTGKARMPYKSEVASLTETNSYLYENLSSELGMIGYWTLSLEAFNFAYAVDCQGVVNGRGNGYNVGYGVRPVISLRIK